MLQNDILFMENGFKTIKNPKDLGWRDILASFF
ncbi:hypothetical protein PT2222_120288 [Paraburkholderia tropica]